MVVPVGSIYLQHVQGYFNLVPVGSLYFQPSQGYFENKTLDRLEVYTSNQSKVILKI